MLRQSGKTSIDSALGQIVNAEYNKNVLPLG